MRYHSRSIGDGCCGTVATIGAVTVAIITFFGIVDHTIAAGRQDAVNPTDISLVVCVGVPIVALLVGPLAPIPADLIDFTGATIGGQRRAGLAVAHLERQRLRAFTPRAALAFRPRHRLA